jgi:hypothetical protein
MGVMKRAILILTLIASACSPAPSSTQPGSPDAVIASVSTFAADSAVVFAGDKALELAEPCSRPAPGPIDSAWTPSEADIAAMEPALSAYLAEQLSAAQETAGADAYLRQYGGLVIDGRRVIVVNGFRRDAAGDLGTWRDFPMIICDGGPIMFGVEYDPAAGAFANFAFNGAV